MPIPLQAVLAGRASAHAPRTAPSGHVSRRYVGAFWDTQCSGHWIPIRRSPRFVVSAVIDAFRLDPRLGPLCLASGQLGYDRSEHVGGDGAEDEVGEADLLPSPLNLLGGCRRVLRKYLQ
jgi:hypothetical protein